MSSPFQFDPRIAIVISVRGSERPPKERKERKRCRNNPPTPAEWLDIFQKSGITLGRHWEKRYYTGTEIEYVGANIGDFRNEIVHICSLNSMFAELMKRYQ